MVPANSSNQIRRLRTLYQYATGTMPRADMTRDLDQAEAERQFLCDYAMQALAVSASPAGNVIYRLEGCQDNNPGRRAHASFMPIRPLPRDRTASSASTTSMRSCSILTSIPT